ncbi:MAG: Fic family protein [Gammaproteobacteria bacterium]|nr:MAG: Fic family protein [Gammaproteobacteria bacterium]
MRKILQPPAQEIVYGSAKPKESVAISREVRAGRLRRIAPKLYTANLKDPPENIIQRHLYQILAHYYPGAVVSHRSALEGGVARDNTIFLTYKYTRRVTLPGITIRLLKGKGPVDGDNPFMEGLYLSSRQRALLENMQPARVRGGVPKSWSRGEIEAYLDEIARVHGEAELNRLRDAARRIATRIKLRAEFKALDAMIGAILGTRKTKLNSEPARARAAGVPYDAHRLERFMTLFAALRRAVLPVRQAPMLIPEGMRNLAFFEAYFSNYIEGTEFMVEEAADIVFRGKRVPLRPADAHDILGTYQIVANSAEMSRVPDTADELIELLKSRHATLLAGRLEKQPGCFKEEVNRAGETVFVAPELVTGTLIKGFEPYRALDDPLTRALYMMFLIAEVHPFADGNGRIARVMLNSELVRGDRVRIIIPTVYREDYLLALRALTRQGNADPYIRMLDRAQDFTARIDFNDYGRALAQLRAANAFLDPHEGRLRMPE